MLPAARKTDKTAHGGVILDGEVTVLIGGQPAARLGDPVECKNHGGGPIVSSSKTVYIGNALAARLLDRVGCSAVGKSGKGVPPVVNGQAKRARPGGTKDVLQRTRPGGRKEEASGPEGPPKAKTLYSEAKPVDYDGDGTTDGFSGEAGVYSDQGHVAGDNAGAKGKWDVGYAKTGANASEGDFGPGGAQGQTEVGLFKGTAEGYWGPDGDGGANPYLAQGVEVDVAHAEAKRDFLAGDDGRRTGIVVAGKAGAELGAIKGTGKATLPLGWIPGVPDDWNIQVNAGLGGSGGAIGAGAGGWVYKDNVEDRYHLGGFGSLKVLAGLDLNLDISLGKEYPPTPPPPDGGGDGDKPAVAKGGIPNLITSGEVTVEIG